MVVLRSRLPSVGQVPNLSYTSFLFNHWPQDGPAKRPDPSLQPCLLDATDGSDRPIYLRELRDRVERLAQGVVAAFGRLSQGTVVCLHAHNTPDFVVTALACLRLGLIFCPLSTAWSPAELAHVVQQAKPKLFISHASIFDAGLAAARTAGVPDSRIVVMGERRPSHPSFGDLARGNATVMLPPPLERQPGWDAGRAVSYYLTSSGTTGLMKIICYTHKSLNAGALQKMIWRNSAVDPWRFEHAHDRTIANLPFYHMGGLIGCLTGCLFANTTVVCVPKAARFHLETTLAQMVKYEATLAWLVPTQLRLMVQNPVTKRYVDRLRLRHILASTAPVSDELERQVRLLLPSAKVMQTYGLTEGGGAVTTAPLDAPSRPGSVGQLFSDVEVKLVDPTSLREVAAGEEGECLVRSPCMTLGYLGNPQATAEAFLPDGWMRTGDIVRVRGDDLYITDRIKAMIKVKGLQVSPAELEGVLIGHDSVLEVVVVPVYDPHAIEVPRAYVVPSPAAAARIATSAAARDAEAASIVAMIDDRGLAPYKRLAGGVDFVAEIPRLPSSKQNRNLVKEWARAADLKRWGAVRARL